MLSTNWWAELTRWCRWCCSVFWAHWRPTSIARSTPSATPPPCTPDQTEEKGEAHTNTCTRLLERECRMSQKHVLTLCCSSTRLQGDKRGKNFRPNSNTSHMIVRDAMFLSFSLFGNHSDNSDRKNNLVLISTGTIFLHSAFTCRSRRVWGQTVLENQVTTNCSCLLKMWSYSGCWWTAEAGGHHTAQLFWLERRISSDKKINKILK